MGSTNKDSRLQCGIVGAGIAGLAAGIALSRAGHDVEIFEKSSFNNEVGAAVSVQPNSSYILQRWGFDFDEAQTTNIYRLRRLDAITTQVTKTTDFEDNRTRYGDNMLSFHRVDLHSQLKALAVAAGAQIRLGTPVADVDVDDGAIKFSDGSSVQKDLVVIASGIHVSAFDMPCRLEMPSDSSTEHMDRTGYGSEYTRQHEGPALSTAGAHGQGLGR